MRFFMISLVLLLLCNDDACDGIDDDDDFCCCHLMKIGVKIAIDVTRSIHMKIFIYIVVVLYGRRKI